ncbi:MAG: response regulator transcription factor [Spirochaetales bacterium]|nr:response regulator transcription factor [Spirochaetales bacterium]
MDEQKTRILIVDDEPINLDFFDVMLSKLGFQVYRAEDGEEALQKVKECDPDLVILDNIMPKLSGWKVTRILKNDVEYQDYRDVPIIMFSAMDDVRDKIEGFELGIEDYIIKPFNFSEVLARIRAVLRSRQLAKQVVQKERRLTLIESLNKSLIYFTRHLKEPVDELQKLVKGVDHSNTDEVKRIMELVEKETGNVLATLAGLEEEIVELEQEDATLQDAHHLLRELEDKFQKHFSSLKNNDREVDRVEG